MHCMPLSVIVQVIRQDIGIIMATGIDGAMFMGDIMGICGERLAFMGGILVITDRADIITNRSVALNSLK
jgi:hypothetical protein